MSVQDLTFPFLIDQLPESDSWVLGDGLRRRYTILLCQQSPDPPGQEGSEEKNCAGMGEEEK